MCLCLRDHMFTRLACKLLAAHQPREGAAVSARQARADQVSAPFAPMKAEMDPDICNPALNKWPDNGCVMNVTMRQTRIAAR